MHSRTHHIALRGLFLLASLFVCFQLVACTSIHITIDNPATPGTTTTSGPGGTSATPGTQPNSQESQIARVVFNAVNKDRAAAGRATLQWSDALAGSARQHDRVMMGANELAHQVAGEPDLGKRETQQGIQWQVAAENIGYTEDMSENGALSLHTAMMAEKPPDDGHRQNILNAQVNKLAVDILFDNIHGRLWLTEDFSKS